MQEDNGLAAFGFNGGKIWAVALSCTLVCAQPGLVPGQAFADSGDQSQPLEISAESYEVNQILDVSNTSLQYYVTDVDNKKVSIGNGKNYSGIKNYKSADSYPTDHSIEIPKTVIDDHGQEWTVSQITSGSLRYGTQCGGYISKYVINADLDYVGQNAFRSTMLESVIWNGKVKEIDSNAFATAPLKTIEFPEGSLVTNSQQFLTSTTVTYENVVFPFSSYNEIIPFQGANQFVDSPWVESFKVTDMASSSGYLSKSVTFWPDSDTEAAFDKAAITGCTGRAMAIFSQDGYSFTASKSADETGTYSHAKNVELGLDDGQLFAGAPDFSLKCAGDSKGNYGYDMVEGVDYNVVYFDAAGNELKEKPTTAGDYSVQFVGNGRASWGSTEKIKFSIIPSISGAEVTSDEDGAAYLYDGKAHAPAIKVTLGNYTLQEGVSYKVTYIGEDGVSSSELPTLPGTYTALVVSEQPSTGGVLGQVKFSITGHQLENGTLAAANVEADADGNAVKPELTLTTVDGVVVPAGAYTVEYKDSDNNTVAAEDLKKTGTYTVVATGDGVGCFGSLEASFTIVKAGNHIASSKQVGSLEYSGQALAPQLKVVDGNGLEVSSDNYIVSYTDKGGNPIAELKEVGTYTATIKAVGSQYVGSTTCEVTVSTQDVADQVEVVLNRTVYDYQSTPIWFDETNPSGNQVVIDRKSKAIDVDATVSLGDKVLQEGVDYVIKSAGDITSSLEDGKSHIATFEVELMGNYGGTKTDSSFSYVINKRIAKTYEYMGVSFSYAVNNDGTAVITGLGVDLPQKATQADIAKAYSANWDGETVTIPGTVEDNDGTKHTVVAVSDCAFSLHNTGELGADTRDIWNGAKKLVIEKNIKEIGYGSMRLGTGYCNVEELSLPEGLEVIHSYAFGASKVKSIEIPSSVTTIGSAAFGEHNGGNTKLKSFTFAKGSKFTNHSEGYWESSDLGNGTAIQVWKECSEFLAGEGDHRDGGTLTKEVAAPMSSIVFPAGCMSANMLMDRFPSCTDYYFMGDSYPSNMQGFQIRGTNQKSEYRMWGWDVENTGLLNVFNMPANYGKNLTFRPFSVLGNSASDTYTYTEAWNAETQAADGTKEYAANTFFGEPEVTNLNGEVDVCWEVTTNFVNSDYTWQPQKGTDYTVKYQKVGSDTQVDKITEAGTYTATLTGNGKTCFGSVTSTVQVDAVSIEDATVTVDDSSLMYTGAGQTPDVTVTMGEDDNAVTLEKGTDYTVEYVNAVDATDSESKATVRVTGCGLYEGTVDQTFEIAQAPLTVTVSNAEKTFGDDDPTFGISSTEGLVGGDSVVTASFTRVKGESAGAYAIACTDIVVKDKSNKRLVTDNYKVTYKDGSLTITGEAAVDIATADVSAIADQTFYGSAVRPAVTVKVGGKELAEGTDYTVSYASNDKVGKATATVTGIGSYAGAKTVEFNVVKLVQFPDVRSSDWFNDSVVSAVRAGYMNGYADGTFGPNDTLTRGQAACVLANMAGADGAVAYTGQFADVEGSEYYAANVAWAKRTGVMSGYAGTSNFGPVDNLTREQMACTLYNFAKYIDGKDVSVADVSATLAKYSDGNGVDSWAAEAVAWAVENGIMGNGGFINATGEITRAEMAAMAVNYMTNLH